MNKIKVDVKKIYDYVDSLNGNGYENLFVENFVFDEYVIIEEFMGRKCGELICSHIDDNANNISIRSRGNVVYPDMTIKATKSKSGYDIYSSIDSRSTTKEAKEYINDVITLVLGFQHLVMNASRTRKSVASSGEETQSHNKQLSNSQNKIYLLDDIIEIVSSNLGKGKREINCPCWQVRGFYRQYKNGNRIWVKPFLKGKERTKEKPKDKEYYI